MLALVLARACAATASIRMVTACQLLATLVTLGCWLLGLWSLLVRCGRAAKLSRHLFLISITTTYIMHDFLHSLGISTSAFALLWIARTHTTTMLWHRAAAAACRTQPDTQLDASRLHRLPPTSTPPLSTAALLAALYCTTIFQQALCKGSAHSLADGCSNVLAPARPVARQQCAGSTSIICVYCVTVYA